MKENGLVLTGDWRPKERRAEGKEVGEAVEKARKGGISVGWIVRRAVVVYLREHGYMSCVEKGKKP